jgi:hypothetical protein
MSLPAVLVPAWAGDCPLDLGHGTGWVLFSDHYMLAFRPDPPVIEAGQPFSLILNVCTRAGDAGQLLSVESERADKPQIIPPSPSIVPGNDGRFRAEGLMFSQPGRWEVTFTVQSGGETERLSHELVVK